MPDASIFLVEDEALVRMTLASMVEELGHRVVAEAGTIKEAGAIAMTGVFDLAILDINIDGLGIDPVAHVIERRGLPFLFVTGYGAEWLPSLAQELGAKRPRRVPRFVGRLFAGEAGVVMMTELRGASNAKAKRELEWAPAHPSWRHGLTAA